MRDLYRAIENLNNIISEGPNKMGPQEIAVGDRVEFEGEKFEVVDVKLGTIVADNLKTGLRKRLKTNKVTPIFGADAMTDKDEEDLEAMFKRLDNVPSGSLKSVATEDSVNEKLDLKKGVYKGTNITPTKLQLDRLKRRGLVPKDYKLPNKKDAKDRIKSKSNKVTRKELPPLEKEPMDIMGAGTKRKKVKATAKNTKNYDQTLKLQKELIAKGAKIDADGIMGPKTRAAMKKFGAMPPMPKPRPKAKSGGPDNRFVTGPELDMPMRPMNPLGPPEKRNRLATITGPELDLPNKTVKTKPVNTIGPNTYRADAKGNYKKVSPNLPQPQSKPGDSIVTRIGKGFDKMGKDLKGIGKNIYNFADKYGIASNLNRFAQRNQNKNKMASRESTQPKKTMIEEITGKKTCL